MRPASSRSAPSRSVAFSLLVAALLAACADKPVAPPPPPPVASAEVPAKPGPSLGHNKTLLGHYTSPDGMIGLVLDRTGDIVKIQVDKSPDIIQLTAKEDRKSGDLVGNRFLSPDGKGVIYIGVRGGIDYYGPRDTLSLRRDADAEPLGAPTVAGVPAPPKKLGYEVLVEEYDAISVVKKLGFKPEDSGNLAKVAEAIEKADKTLFVHYASKVDAATFAPAPETIGGTTFGGATGGGYPLEDDNKEKLGSYGGVLRGWTTDTGGGYIRLYTPSKKTLLAQKTPGLVWEAGATSVIFVTLDGGRYRVDASHQTVEQGAPLLKGLPAQGDWPPALQHSIYDTSATQYLGKAGAIPTSVHEAAEKIDEEWRACANKEAKALHDKLDAAKSSRKLLENHIPATRKKCAAAEKKMVKHLTEFADARNKERTALYEKAKAKLGK